MTKVLIGSTYRDLIVTVEFMDKLAAGDGRKYLRSWGPAENHTEVYTNLCGWDDGGDREKPRYCPFAKYNNEMWDLVDSHHIIFRTDPAVHMLMQECGLIDPSVNQIIEVDEDDISILAIGVPDYGGEYVYVTYRTWHYTPPPLSPPESPTPLESSASLSE